MSLIYQSLKKLQSGEESTGTAPGPPRSPDREFRLPSIGRVLLGIALLGAAVYGAWIFSGSDAPRSSPPRAADKSGATPGQPEESLSAGNTSQPESTAFKHAAKGSGAGNHTGRSAANETTASSGTKHPALLHLSCRRNGTRARLSLEFDREPATPETSWDRQTRTLDMAFPGSRVDIPETRLISDPPRGLDISLTSREPLGLRLKVPELKGHNAFLIRESAEYGPRFVLALRLAPDKEQGHEPSARTKASPPETPDTPKNSARNKQVGDNASEAEESPRPESEEKSASGSMEVVSSTPQDRSPEGKGAEADEKKRVRDRERNKGAAKDLLQRLQSDPGNIDVRIRYAKDLVAEKRYGRALQVLQLDNPPNVEDNITYYALAAYASRKLGRNQRAARIYQSLAENEPGKGKWWMGLGLCLERTGQSGAALKAYERALNASGLGEEVRAFVQKRKQRLARTRDE